MCKINLGSSCSILLCDVTDHRQCPCVHASSVAALTLQRQSIQPMVKTVVHKAWNPYHLGLTNPGLPTRLVESRESSENFEICSPFLEGEEYWSLSSPRSKSLFLYLCREEGSMAAFLEWSTIEYTRICKDPYKMEAGEGAWAWGYTGFGEADQVEGRTSERWW